MVRKVQTFACPVFSDHLTYTDMLRHVIADVYNKTVKDEDCSEWGEVNELKYLFRSQQHWTRQQANDFLVAAWKYMGYHQ